MNAALRLSAATGDDTSASPSRFAFVQVKAFGDLTIAAASLRALPTHALRRCSLLIGPHLDDLASALAPNCAVETLALAERGVPPIFDMKRHGLAAGIRSALSLREALRIAAPGAILVMPRSARRERFVAGRRPVTAMPTAENVYLAHERFLQAQFGASTTAHSAPTPGPLSRRIALCPFSRVATKNVPEPLVADMAATCVGAGFEPELLLLEGEQMERPPAGLAVRTLPRRFGALAEALAGYAGVISADSLAAHLAEYRGTPAFVATRVPNTYWLPARTFKGRHWGLFDDTPELTAHLQRFLDTAQP